MTAEDLAALQTDVLVGFVLARAAAGLSDGTIACDVLHLEQVRGCPSALLQAVEQRVYAERGAYVCVKPVIMGQDPLTSIGPIEHAPLGVGPMKRGVGLSAG